MYYGPSKKVSPVTVDAPTVVVIRELPTYILVDGVASYNFAKWFVNELTFQRSLAGKRKERRGSLIERDTRKASKVLLRSIPEGQEEESSKVKVQKKRFLQG